MPRCSKPIFPCGRKQYGAKLCRLEFRNKDKGWHRSSVRMEFGNRKVYHAPITEDAYMNGFLNSYMLKPCCYDCHFRNFSAGCDLALGDFWGIETMPTWHDDNIGTSAVLVNTEKGKAIPGSFRWINNPACLTKSYALIGTLSAPHCRIRRERRSMPAQKQGV